ncbi:hypothetical protein HOP50_01g07410 [Chloropicon primus]|nr:hypothetical protein HOP50_01g07410 [Chloropicon primus]
MAAASSAGPLEGDGVMAADCPNRLAILVDVAQLRSRRCSWTWRIFDSQLSLMATEKDVAQLAREDVAQLAREDVAQLARDRHKPGVAHQTFEAFDYAHFTHFLRVLERFTATCRGRVNKGVVVDRLQQVSRCLTGVLSTLDHNASIVSWVFSSYEAGSDRVEEIKTIGARGSLLRWFSPGNVGSSGSPGSPGLPKAIEVLELRQVMAELRERRREMRERGMAVLREATSLATFAPSSSEGTEVLCPPARTSGRGVAKAADVERTRALLDQSLESYNNKRGAVGERGGGTPEASDGDGDGSLSRLVADSNLELQSFYNTSESGLRPHTVVHKVVSSFFSSRACKPSEAFSGCKDLFVDRATLKEKYGKGFKGSKEMKVKEYLTQILLRLESANQAMTKAPESREEGLLLGKQQLKELKQMLKDIMFSMPAAIPGSGVKELLETIVSPSFPHLERTVHQLKSHFGLASQANNRKRAEKAEESAQLNGFGVKKEEGRGGRSSSRRISSSKAKPKPKSAIPSTAAAYPLLPQSQSSQAPKVCQQSQSAAQQQPRFHGNLARQVSLKLGVPAKSKRRGGRPELGRENKKPCVRKDTVLETPFLKKR